jgi:hypothetical protein
MPSDPGRRPTREEGEKLDGLAAMFKKHYQNFLPRTPPAVHYFFAEPATFDEAEKKYKAQIVLQALEWLRHCNSEFCRNALATIEAQAAEYMKADRAARRGSQDLPPLDRQKAADAFVLANVGGAGASLYLPNSAAFTYQETNGLTLKRTVVLFNTKYATETTMAHETAHAFAGIEFHQVIAVLGVSGKAANAGHLKEGVAEELTEPVYKAWLKSGAPGTKDARREYLRVYTDAIHKTTAQAFLKFGAAAKEAWFGGHIRWPVYDDDDSIEANEKRKKKKEQHRKLIVSLGDTGDPNDKKAKKRQARLWVWPWLIKGP